MSTKEEESPLDPDEPHTPIWFTFLGIGLFLLGGIFLLASQDEETEAPEAPDAAIEAEADTADQPGENVAEPDPHAGHDH